jgi:hypothetical protein
VKEAQLDFSRLNHIQLMTVPPVEGTCLFVQVTIESLPRIVQETDVQVPEFDARLFLPFVLTHISS